MEDIEEEVPMSAQYLAQLQENEILKAGVMIGIKPEDNDDEHLVAMGDINPEDDNMILHQQLHIQAKIDKGTQAQETNPMLA